MRKVVALALSLALQVAAVAAPLAHSHPDEHATDHHTGSAIHAHWAAHRPADHRFPVGPALEDVDHDRAVSVSSFIAVAVSSFAVPGITEQAFDLPASIERAGHCRIEVVRSHDPPALRSLPSRAPPFSLS